MTKNNHFNKDGNAQMIDISDKVDSKRTAAASGSISVSKEVIEIIKKNKNKKGDVMAVARIAGIQGAKKTSDLIPLAHPINISSINIDFNIDENKMEILCKSEVSCVGKTGVEIEAIMSVQICLITIYDMCKYIDRSMKFNDIKLLFKDGGKSGSYSTKK